MLRNVKTYLCSWFYLRCMKLAPSRCKESGVVEREPWLAKKKSSLLNSNPFLDSTGSLRVGGCELTQPNCIQVIIQSFSQVKPSWLSVQNTFVCCLLVLTCSFSQHFYIIQCRKVVREITRGCTTCRHLSTKFQAQLFSQLPIEEPDLVFIKVRAGYAGPVYIKCGHVRKQVVVTAYIRVFVSLSIKAVHFELPSNHTIDHCRQKWRSKDLLRCQRLNIDTFQQENAGSGCASRGLPIRKCPGVRAPTPSSSWGRGTSRRVLRLASMCIRRVLNSSKVSLTFATTRFNCFFTLYGCLPKSA